MYITSSTGARMQPKLSPLPLGSWAPEHLHVILSRLKLPITSEAMR